MVRRHEAADDPVRPDDPVSPNDTVLADDPLAPNDTVTAKDRRTPGDAVAAIDGERRGEIEAWRLALVEPKGDIGAATDPDRLWAAAAGELEAEETAELAQRAIDNPDDALAWRLAVELQEAARAETASPTQSAGDVVAFERPVRPSRRVPMWGAALAALLALALGLGVLMERGGTPSQDVMRGDVATSIVASDGAMLSLADPVLRWQAPEAAGPFRVVVTTDTFEPLLSRPAVEAMELRLPDEVLARLQPGDRLLWSVGGAVAGTPTRSTFESEIVAAEL
ncbi:MAG: hypothetical protein AAGN46_03625 [Acidobacteriota bacterium]